MKKLIYRNMLKQNVLWIMALISTLIVGCNSDSDTVGYSSNENAIVSFSLKLGSQWEPIKVYADSLVLNVPKGFKFDNVDAKCILTEHSTISPDPATITDWSSDKEFVVTAPDGKTKKVYLYKVHEDTSGSVVEGFYSFSSQEDVNAFVSKNLTKVLGISINGTTEKPITDLSPLNSIVEIEYQLNINGFQGTTLNGLTKLERVANIYVKSDSLEEFRLDALKQVNNANIGFNAAVAVSTTPKLKGIYWEKLEVIYNTLNVFALSIDNFLGWSSLKSIGGECTIRASAKSYSGLDKLESVFNILLVNANATSLEGLSSLTKVSREFQMSFMNSLTTLNGLNLKTVKYLNLNNCTKLTDITALKNIEELDVLFLSGITNLVSLEGLHNLKTIKTKFELNSLTKLQNLDGLRSLEGIGTDVAVRYCYALTSYCGISNALQSYKGSWYMLSNGYNPTLEQVKTTCKN